MERHDGDAAWMEAGCTNYIIKLNKNVWRLDRKKLSIQNLRNPQFIQSLYIDLNHGISHYGEYVLNGIFHQDYTFHELFHNFKALSFVKEGCGAVLLYWNYYACIWYCNESKWKLEEYDRWFFVLLKYLHSASQWSFICSVHISKATMIPYWKTATRQTIRWNRSIRPGNNLVCCHPNVCSVQESFIKTEADTRRSFMANAAGQDLNSNSGRRKQSLDFRARIRFIVNGYETATKADYLSMIAHELAKD